VAISIHAQYASGASFAAKKGGSLSILRHEWYATEVKNRLDRHAEQSALWYRAELAEAPGHPFYRRLNQDDGEVARAAIMILKSDR